MQQPPLYIPHGRECSKVFLQSFQTWRELSRGAIDFERDAAFSGVLPAIPLTQGGPQVPRAVLPAYGGRRTPGFHVPEAGAGRKVPDGTERG